MNPKSIDKLLVGVVLLFTSQLIAQEKPDVDVALTQTEQLSPTDLFAAAEQAHELKRFEDAAFLVLISSLRSVYDDWYFAIDEAHLPSRYLRRKKAALYCVDAPESFAAAVQRFQSWKPAVPTKDYREETTEGFSEEFLEYFGRTPSEIALLAVEIAKRHEEIPFLQNISELLKHEEFRTALTTDKGLSEVEKKLNLVAFHYDSDAVTTLPKLIKAHRILEVAEELNSWQLLDGAKIFSKLSICQAQSGFDPWESRENAAFLLFASQLRFGYDVMLFSEGYAGRPGGEFEYQSQSSTRSINLDIRGNPQRYRAVIDRVSKWSPGKPADNYSPGWEIKERGDLKKTNAYLEEQKAEFKKAMESYAKLLDQPEFFKNYKIVHESQWDRDFQDPDSMDAKKLERFQKALEEVRRMEAENGMSTI